MAYAFLGIVTFWVGINITMIFLMSKMTEEDWREYKKLLLGE